MSSLRRLHEVNVELGARTEVCETCYVRAFFQYHGVERRTDEYVSVDVAVVAQTKNAG
jgi:hypothetical protein